MKITVATGLYPPEIGGPATYSRMLEEQLPTHGFEVNIIAFGSVRAFPKVIRHFVFTWKLIEGCRTSDVLYALDPVSVGAPALMASWITRKKLIVRVAGDYAWEQGQRRFGIKATLDEFVLMRSSHVGVRFLQKVQSFVARHAYHVIVPSEYLKCIVMTWGVRSENITRIYSALIPLQVSETKEELRKQFDFTDYVIVTAGRLVPWKGIACLIDVVARLREKGILASLVVVGDGPLLYDLKAHAKNMALESHVRFVGRQPKHTLGAVIKGSDVFVLNTAYEGLSHQLLEVMDLGVPIITTNVGGNPELISHRESGLLVPFDDTDAFVDALVEIKENQDLEKTLTSNAKKRTRDFRQEMLISKLADFMNQTMLEK